MTGESHSWWCWLLYPFRKPVLRWDTVKHYLYCKRCGTLQ